jgi:hypothetical protein
MAGWDSGKYSEDFAKNATAMYARCVSRQRRNILGTGDAKMLPVPGVKSLPIFSPQKRAA